jgi:hypothetical protein
LRIFPPTPIEPAAARRQSDFLDRPHARIDRIPSTGANRDCLVNFALRSGPERVFAHRSSSYGLFCVYGWTGNFRYA